ncbi:MAG: hypothetical protein A3C53_04355 [Omnitrophica WOR_2 bacterium RIFCSPHIGHO2_02_FULL_68_15]|nr:MAG: hypothetical protein A3C53_04355 [Omnitrophica WOR_2 bacterium RIFCSPHIGHO2_02_FULL_68_15]
MIAEQLLARLRRTVRAAAALSAFFGSIVFLGWAAPPLALPGFLPPLVTMSANSALCFILAGAALWLSQDERGEAWRHRVAGAAAASVALLSGLTVVEYFSQHDLGIDRLLFAEPWHAANAPAASARMALSTALSFCLAGAALLTVNVAPRRGLAPAEPLAFSVVAISLLALIGYVLDVPIRGVGFYYQMALYSALALVILGGGILCLRPARGLMATITADSAGGVMARRFLPAVVGVPVLLGWLRSVGTQVGFYNVEFGRLLLVLLVITAFTALALWNAALLNRMDADQRRAAEALRAERQALAEANERLTTTSRFKTDFINTLNHELRTPLTTIQSGLHLALTDPATAASAGLQASLETVNHSVGRLLRLVEGLLDLSKIEAGRLECQLAPCGVAQLLDEGVSNHRPTAAARGIALSSFTAPGVRPVTVDYDRILEVVDNLLSNALKFTPSGGEVNLIARSWGEQFVCIEVEDNGIGIRPEDQPRLFQRFSRIANPHGRHVEGSGLGLAICKAIVEGHGGAIWVQSGEGRGSRFCFTVPAARPG